jgi:hypothetical protein
MYLKELGNLCLGGIDTIAFGVINLCNKVIALKG